MRMRRAWWLATAVPIVLVLAVALVAGCSRDIEQVGFVYPDNTACEVMQPHMPEVVQRADTRGTRVGALLRNQAWSHACPAASAAPARPQGEAGRSAASKAR